MDYLTEEDINVPIEVLEEAVVTCIRTDVPAWISCNDDKACHRSTGVMSQDIYPIEAAFKTKLGMSKKERMLTGEENLIHSMVINAVHIENGRPVRYRGENAASRDVGKEGFLVMADEWFREHVYQVVVPRGLADEKWVKVLDAGNPVEWETWEPLYAA